MNNSSIKHPAAAPEPGVLSPVLGSYIQYGDRRSLYSDTTLSITPGEIKDPFLSAMLGAIQDLAMQSAPLDVISVSSYLCQNYSGSMPDYIKEVQHVTDLVTAVVMTSFSINNPDQLHRAESVVKQMMLSEMLKQIPEVLDQSNKDADPPAVTLQKVRELIDTASSKTWNTETIIISDENLPQQIASLQERLESNIGKPVIRLAQAWWGKWLVSSIERGQLVVFAGETSVGKSSLMHQWAEEEASRIPVLFIHLEDGPDMVLTRAASRQSPKDKYSSIEMITRGDKFNALENYTQLRKKWRERGGGITYIYKPAPLPSEVLTEISQACERARVQGRPYQMIFFDYLQKVQVDAETGKGSNRTNTIDSFVDHCRALAEAYNAVFVLGSQVTVDQEKNVSIRDSKSTAQKSQLLCYYERSTLGAGSSEFGESSSGKKISLAEEGQKSGYGILRVSKQSNGGTGIIKPLLFDQTRFAAYHPRYLKETSIHPELIDAIPRITRIDETRIKEILEREEAVNQWLMSNAIRER